MYDLWKCSTKTFAIQAVIVVLMSVMIGSIPFAVSLGLAAIVTFIIAILVPDRSILLCDVLMSATFGVAFAAIVVFVASLSSADHRYILVVPLILAVSIAAALKARSIAREAQEEGAKESLSVLFIAAYPLGVGAVFGGAILLYRRFRHHEAVGT